MDKSYRDKFFHSYVATALWSTNDESDESGGVPMDANYTPDDIDFKTLAKMRADCDRFIDENAKWLALTDRDASLDGHDFWLNRNGHGAGFWDGDLPDDVGDALDKASEKFGEVYLYVDFEAGIIYDEYV